MSVLEGCLSNNNKLISLRFMVTTKLIAPSMASLKSAVNCSTPVFYFYYCFLNRLCQKYVDIFMVALPVSESKKWSMLGVCLSSCGCMQEVGRAQEKRLSGTRQN